MAVMEVACLAGLFQCGMKLVYKIRFRLCIPDFRDLNAKYDLQAKKYLFASTSSSSFTIRNQKTPTQLGDFRLTHHPLALSISNQSFSQKRIPKLFAIRH